MTNQHEHILSRIVAALADLPGAAALTLGGSTASGLGDATSDLDVYMYFHAPLASDEDRAARLRALADPETLKIGITDWGLEDHLHIQGTLVELIYFDLDDLRAQVEQAYGEGLISEGYTTSFLYTLASSQVLHDPNGEASALRARLHATYPEPTRARLLRAHPKLLPYFVHLLRVAQRRGDLLSVQHQRYTIQVFFFNLLFALNRIYHPGEKRLLIHAQRCAVQPANLTERWNAACRLPADDAALADGLDALINDLCQLIETDNV